MGREHKSSDRYFQHEFWILDCFGQPGCRDKKSWNNTLLPALWIRGVERKNILWMVLRATTKCWYSFFQKTKLKKIWLTSFLMHVVDICTRHDKNLTEIVLKKAGVHVSVSVKMSRQPTPNWAKYGKLLKWMDSVFSTNFIMWGRISLCPLQIWRFLFA